MSEWKSHAVVPRRKPTLGINNFREMIERTEAERPEIPVYSYRDYTNNKQCEVMPKDLRMQAEGLGTWLYEKGKHKKIIGICGPNCYEWLLAFYGTHYAGSIILLLDRTVDEDILKDQIGRAGCKDLIYSADVSEKVRSLAADMGLEIYPFDSIADLAREGREMIEKGASACLDSTIDGDDTAVIMFTSGTTGISKGVMLSSKNLLMNCECIQDILDMKKKQVLLLPLNHVYGFWSQLEALTTGTCLEICVNHRYMLDVIKAAKPELLVLVPLIIKNLYGAVRMEIRKRGDEEKVRQMIRENNEKGNVSDEEKRKMFEPYLSVLGGRLEKMISGGAPIDDQLVNDFRDFGIHILVGYGITECSPALSVNTVELSKPGTVGMIFPGHEILIENPDENGIGEICAKGPGIMKGYYHMENETREALAGGWFHTGDLGRVDEDNYLTITGRIKNLIILSNGENISAEELESKLSLCKAISEVVVYEKDDRIAAMIYPDKEYTSHEGIEDPEAYIKDFIYNYNLTASSVRKIGFVFFRDTPFERTASTKKIKRNFEKM